MFAHVVVSGFVQGIGYRQFTKRVAQNLSLKGWVRNIDQGRVETAMVGPREKIEEAIGQLKKGPFLSEVKDITVEWEEKEPNFNSFEIIV